MDARMMTHRAGACLAAALATVVSMTSLGAAPVDRSAAPADQYFGAQKMSALGIRMKIDALGRRYHARTISDDDLLHDASIAEASLRAWAGQYPRDPWLAPAAFHLEQLDQTVQSQAARAQATALLHYIAQKFGKTKYGHLSRLRLAQGFAPLHGESAVTATPNPYASASASSSPSASVSPAVASPAAAPTAGASSAPIPSATPSAAPRK